MQQIDIKDTQKIKVAGMLNYMDVEYFLTHSTPIVDNLFWETSGVYPNMLRFKAIRATPIGATKKEDAIILTAVGDVPVFPAPADVVVYIGAGQKFIVDYEVCTRDLEIVCRLPKTNTENKE
jgi:hypothetical protein